MPGGVYGAATPSTFDKGKGKEVIVGTPAAAPTPNADGGDGGEGDDDEGGKGEKKRRNYRHLMRDIPGAS